MTEKTMAAVLDEANWLVLVKHVHYIKCLNASATNCATFWNQMLSCGTLFFLKKKMNETKNSSELQFKA